MKKPILICLCHVLLLFALSFPVDARTLVGLSPASPLSQLDHAKLKRLSESFEKFAGTEVTFRRFDSDAALTNWLMRFQEIDAAIVPPTFINEQPAGALQRLLDLHTERRSSPPMALVVRSNLSSVQAAQVRDAFLKVNNSDRGHKLLRETGLLGVTRPGVTLKPKAAQPARAKSQPVKENPLPAAPPAQPIRTVRPKEASQPALAGQAQTKTISAAQKSAEKPPAPLTNKKPELKNETKSPAVAEKVSSQPAREVAARPKITQQPPVQTQAEDKRLAIPTAADKQPAVKHHENEKKQSPETDKPEPASNKRVLLFVSLLLILAVLTKICLFALRWRETRKTDVKPEEIPVSNAFISHTGPSSPVAEVKKAAADEQVVIETGRLGPGKVPALLKQCADMPKPVALLVSKGACEKLIHFAGGQVASALTQNSTTAESGVRWDKLGSLLVREELITGEERDQALALISKSPELSFGEALLKLGLIDLPGLRHALARQAKVTIFSLILFPEGRYQIITDDDSLSPEESVSIEVTSLIREASHHKSEWTAIRQALPNLSTILDFTVDGREKLENVSLSPQQEATLSLINNRTTINDICIGSSMMDYEVHRFLYLMVKAGALKPVA